MPRRTQANGSPDLRPLVLHYVRSKPATTTIGELLADSVIGGFIRSLTVAELIGGEVPFPRGGGRRGRRVAAASPRTGEANTRTADGRNAYDSRVLAAIKAAGGPASAESLLSNTGGDAAQFRAATKRLLAAKKIKRTGKARGTRYAA